MFFDICNAEIAQSLSSLQKSEFLKLIISFLHYFGAKIEISGTKWVEKIPIASYWGFVPSQRYNYQKTILQRLIFL